MSDRLSSTSMAGDVDAVPLAKSVPDYHVAKHIDQSEIPVIDVSKLLSGNAEAHAQAVADVAAQIVAASQRIGFFYIAGHGIAPEVMALAQKAMRDYFALPSDIKAQRAVNTSQRGWMAQGVTRLEGSKTHDLKEIFFWGPEQWDARLTALKQSDPLIADNLWPDDVFPALRRDLLPYYDAVQIVGRKLLSAIAVGLKVSPNFFEQRYTSPMARGQLVYYPVSTAQDEQVERFGSAPHTDFGVLTLLLQDANGGLQVRNKQDEWIAAPPIEATLVCNIGDLLHRWSNETLSSNLHRVINRSGNERHSIAIFFDPDPDAVIDPADLGFADARDTYPPVTASAYIHGKNKKNFSHYGK